MSLFRQNSKPSKQLKAPKSIKARVSPLVSKEAVINTTQHNNISQLFNVISPFWQAECMTIIVTNSLTRQEPLLLINSNIS
ncbi:hypothetical protein TUM4445_11620 [Shewanella sp. MBTL60-112-B2]|nr:hypothetical protein TUM4444_24460 [Shewanella sp. MBTL60-112-B1]GIU29425.1 hypothetical protein TUM4445_11620 [Shewanella sp. MBTL60-112-B2]